MAARKSLVRPGLRLVVQRPGRRVRQFVLPLPGQRFVLILLSVLSLLLFLLLLMSESSSRPSLSAAERALLADRIFASRSALQTGLDDLLRRIEPIHEAHFGPGPPPEFAGHAPRDRLLRSARELEGRVGDLAAYYGAYEIALRGIPHRWPVDSERRQINSGYGYRRDPFGGRGQFHRGADIKGRSGDPVIAAADGTVRSVRRASSGYGNVVRVFHNSGYETLYAHLSEISVQQDQIVRAGDRIGTVGTSGHSTGPHLHYEVYFENKALDPDGYLVP
ncbi:MAG: M23 family metallopeptidase [Spirochaetales bacterium]|nr:M23 family metallopeptidase [Leptospiraceae bacterium]MCP5480419.1 M23 family metallopeptidase [Spirochaetales bacterium]